MSKILGTVGLSLALAAFAPAAINPARANDLGVGLGLTWVFGSGPNGGLAAGAKVFTDRKKDQSAGSLGLDYHFGSAALRPNLGISYLGDGASVDASFGYNIGTRNIDFGLGGGLVDTKD